MGRGLALALAALTLVPLATAHLPSASDPEGTYGPRDACVRRHATGGIDGPHRYGSATTLHGGHDKYLTLGERELGLGEDLAWRGNALDGNRRQQCGEGRDAYGAGQYAGYTFRDDQLHEGNYDGDVEWAPGGGTFASGGGLHSECWPENSGGWPDLRHHGAEFTIGDHALAGVAPVYFFIGANDVHPKTKVTPNPDPFAPEGSTHCVVDNVNSPSTDCDDYQTGYLADSGAARMRDPRVHQGSSPLVNDLVADDLPMFIDCAGIRTTYWPSYFPPGALGDYVLYIETIARNPGNLHGAGAEQVSTATFGHICDGIKPTIACRDE